MTKKLLITVIVVAALVAAIVGTVFYIFITRPSDPTEGIELTEVDELVTMDIENDYPSSVRAVTNLWSRFMTCLYNEEYTDEEYEKMIMNMRHLMDSDLQKQNPEETYISAMKADIEDYRSKNWTISNYTIPDTDDVTYKEIDGVDMALLTVSYFVKQDTAYAKSYQNYVLKKNSDGLWKIYGYSLKETVQTDSDGKELEQ